MCINSMAGVKSIGGFEKHIAGNDHEIRYSKKMWDVFIR